MSILKRSTAEKARSRSLPRPGKKQAGPVLEDWWLVRDAENRVGWVLARMVDVDAPLDIAQYAEGQRFVAFFVLDTPGPNTDPDKKTPVSRQRQKRSAISLRVYRAARRLAL